MKKSVNKTLIGAFVVGALTLLVTGILALEGTSLFEDSDNYVLYFSGSVKGLGRGAPVQLKGVTLGKVTAINLVYDLENESFLNRVAFETTEGSIKIAGSPQKVKALSEQSTMEETVDKLVADGLRAKLKIQSFVTGQLLVAFDFYPDTPVNLVGIKDEYHELPTLPSDMEALEKTLENLDIVGLVDTFKSAATGIDALINSNDMQTLAANINRTLSGYRRLAVSLETEATATLADARRLIKTTEGQISPMAEGITGTAADLSETITHLNQRIQPAVASIETAAASANKAFNQADAMLSNLAYLSGEESALVYRINATLTETRKAAHALALLADYLNRHPEALLRGKKAVGGTN
jgi:paraquat-inducible protein B